MSHHVEVAVKKSDRWTRVGKPYRSYDSARKFAQSIVDRGHAHAARVTDESKLTLFDTRDPNADNVGQP